MLIAAADSSDEGQEKGLELIGKLESKNFAGREVAVTELDCWADGSKKKFVFKGSYWDAMDELLDTFPTRSADRELLSNSGYRMGRWREEDFKAAAQFGGVSSGILKVRHARMALENNGAKDYLVVTLVPSVEPGYQVEGLALTVKGLALEDSTLLEPLQQSLGWQAKSNGSQFCPAALFTWNFLLEKGVKLGSAVVIEGAASLSVRRLVWSEVDLPEEMNKPV